MVTLSIDFQDGFKDDSVVVHVNRQEVYHKKQISTKLLLGLADTFKTEVAKGAVSVKVDVQSRNISKVILLEVSAETYLGCSIVNGKIEHIVSNKPFGYG